MSAYRKIFGDMNRGDSEFIAKFAVVEAIVRSRHNDYDVLYDVLTGSKYGGLGGEPGWGLDKRPKSERRDEQLDVPEDVKNLPEYRAFDHWPEDADFVATISVSVEDFPIDIDYPICYLTRAHLYEYLNYVIDASLKFGFIEKTPGLEKILSIIRS